jgi:3-deoxy-D-manno-octulosonic-acid transferase
MYLIYTFLLATALLVASPYFLLRFRRYMPALRDRLGYLKIPRFHRSIWVHAVSVGEVKAVQQLTERLRLAYPGKPIVLSTATPAGQNLARNIEGLADAVFFFPLDLPGPIRRTLDHIDPELLLVAETEIWPNLLRACRNRQVRVVMVNGRISDRSLPRYRLVRRWLKRVLADYTLLGVQSETDRERIESIGADPSKVAVFGNLKYDAFARTPLLEPALSALLRDRQPLWIAASTTPGEEELVLRVFAELRRHHPPLALLLAPRHPERFEGVAKLADSFGFPVIRRSDLSAPPHPLAAVILLDSIGELSATFEHASVVFMGGTLVPRGGHNILEPAAFARPIVFGPHMENFRDISALFLEAGAAIQVKGEAELVKIIDQLLCDPAAAAALGRRARSLVDENTGATERVLAFLQ